MLSIHPQDRTTPAVRQEIARSSEPTGVLAKRFGVSTETIRKWCKRGPKDCQDHSSRPHKLPWKATDEERAIVCALRQATGFPLDDLTFVVSPFPPGSTGGFSRCVLRRNTRHWMPLASVRCNLPSLESTSSAPALTEQFRQACALYPLRVRRHFQFNSKQREDKNGQPASPRKPRDILLDKGRGLASG